MLPPEKKDQLVNLRSEIIKLVRDNNDLAHKIEVNNAEIHHKLKQLDNVAFDSLVETGHDTRDYIVNADTNQIESRHNVRR